MKKLFAFIIALTLSAGAIYAATDRHSTNKADLPKAARDFIDKHFAKNKLAVIEIDNDSYDVKFSEGLEIDFRTNGEWKEIESKTIGIPTTVLINPIKKYLAQNYKDEKITKVSRNHNGFEVEINDNVELMFSTKGEFLGLDD